LPPKRLLLQALSIFGIMFAIVIIIAIADARNMTQKGNFTSASDGVLCREATWRSCGYDLTDCDDDRVRLCVGVVLDEGIEVIR
jgi:hypothetical protein